MHSLLSTAQAKWKAWDQACYTPVFMGALSSLTVTYMHTFVLIISTHALDTCPIFILLYKRRKIINTEPDKPNSGDRTIISAPSLSSAVWHKWQWLSILPFLLPPCPCFSNFKVFSQVGEWHCFPAPWFPWMRSARLPWGRGTGGFDPAWGAERGALPLAMGEKFNWKFTGCFFWSELLASGFILQEQESPDRREQEVRGDELLTSVVMIQTRCRFLCWKPCPFL